MADPGVIRVAWICHGPELAAFAREELNRHDSDGSFDEWDVVSAAVERELANPRPGATEDEVLTRMRAAVRAIAAHWAEPDGMTALQPGTPTGALLEYLSPEVAAVRSENYDALATAFERLPDRYQEVLWLATVSGLNPSEVGAQMDLTPDHASVLAHRARTRLRALWQSEESPLTQ